MAARARSVPSGDQTGSAMEGNWTSCGSDTMRPSDAEYVKALAPKLSPEYVKRVNANVPNILTVVTFAVALSAPVEAVTVVVPDAIAVTIPSLLPTVAIAGSAADHST